MSVSTIQRAADWRDYYQLTKPKVVMLIVFTAIVGMFMAVPGWPGLVALLASLLLFFAISLAQPAPKIARDVEAILDA